MGRETVVLLDLEETLIDDWCGGRNALPELIERVRNFCYFHSLAKQSTVKLGLMSWAVHDERDRAIFNTELRPGLEGALNLKFSDEFVLTMSDWATHILHSTGKLFDRDELLDMCGKEEVLFRLIRKSPLFQGKIIVLIDDAVVSFTMEVIARNTNLQVINVNDLP